MEKEQSRLFSLSDLWESCQMMLGGLELADAWLPSAAAQKEGNILPKTQEQQHPVFSIRLPQQTYNAKV